MKLTLLGTGMPNPDPNRRGPSQVVESGGEVVLIDCGSGVAQRLVEAGYARRPIARLAITHLHSDHITGLPDLLWGGWVGRWWDAPPVISGPPGTARFVAKLLDAFEYDISVRMKGERLKREWLVPRVEEVEEGTLIEGTDWRLTAFRVEHQPVDQAFGYRLEEGGRSLVVSGDTCASEAVVKHAERCDLLVHEVYWAAGSRALLDGLTDPDQIARRQTINAYHTPSDEVGKVATRAEAGRLVLSHLLLRGATPEQLRAEVAQDYRGPVAVGEDLDQFEV